MISLSKSVAEVSKKEKIFASIILHALGDTIGYKNSDWEFGVRGDLASRLQEKVDEYVDLGGVNYVPEKGWKYSDDTILNIAVLETLLKEKDNVEKFNDIFVKKLLLINEKEFKDVRERRPGISTLKSIDTLKTGVNWRNIAYDKYSGGSGVSMRSIPFGLVFNNISNEEVLDKLIQFSIESGKVTHNNPTGYLGGFVSAYFAALAFQRVDIKKWPFMLMDIVNKTNDDGSRNKDFIKKYIFKTRGMKEYETQQVIFFSKWDKYIKDKFDKNKNIIQRKSDKNLVCRSKYYYDSFGFKENMFIGGSGDDSVIIAYDSLLDSAGKWEKLVFYSMLHSGDTDTTGCIAAGLYGAYYGFGDVPKHLLKNIENYDKLKIAAEKLLSIIH